jgi:tryptophan-rich sensory protein
MTGLSKPKQLIGLGAWLLVCYAASIIGALASIQARSFYAQLSQPAWAPPGWVFGPVWTTLYTMMAVSAWLVWRQGGFKANRNAMLLFLLQLAVNALWSWLFFTWQLGALALADIVLLWVLILATLVAFWRVSPLAGVLLAPYLLWVGFAGFLNHALWQLNPQLLG